MVFGRRKEKDLVDYLGDGHLCQVSSTWLLIFNPGQEFLVLLFQAVLKTHYEKEKSGLL
jgi:hypothetical protein